MLVARNLAWSRASTRPQIIFKRCLKILWESPTILPPVTLPATSFSPASTLFSNNKKPFFIFIWYCNLAKTICYTLFFSQQLNFRNNLSRKSFNTNINKIIFIWSYYKSDLNFAKKKILPKMFIFCFLCFWNAPLQLFSTRKMVNITWLLSLVIILKNNRPGNSVYGSNACLCIRDKNRQEQMWHEKRRDLIRSSVIVTSFVRVAFETQDWMKNGRRVL